MQNVHQTRLLLLVSTEPPLRAVSPLCPYCGVSPPLLSPVSSEAECCSQETAAEVAEVQSLSIYNIVLVSSQPPGQRIGEIQMIPGVDFRETGFCRNFDICKHASAAIYSATCVDNLNILIFVCEADLELLKLFVSQLVSQLVRSNVERKTESDRVTK